MHRVSAGVLKVMGAGLLLAGAALKLPALLAAFLANLALLPVVAGPACDLDWYACRYSPQAIWYPPQPLPTNSQTLRQALAGFRQAAALDPANRRAALHAAEMLFAAGDRAEAAAVMAEAGWPAGPEPDPLSNSLAWQAGSPLLTVGRYEYYLMRAHRLAQAEQWEAAVREFQFGVAYAGERAAAQDWRDFFQATARWRSHTAASDERGQPLAGKYYALAGDWDSAVKTLQPVVASRSALAEDDLAWAAYYLGQAHEGRGDPAAALDAYRVGWQASAGVRENGIQLARLLSAVAPAEAETVALALQAAGPAFLAGRTGPDYRFEGPGALASGWTFVGYDLDPESLEHGGPVEVWLWWQPPAPALPAAAGQTLVTAGEYVLQRQQLVNRIPNSAFEWGEKSDGVPLGWAGRVYLDDPGSANVTTVERGGRATRVAVAANLPHDSSGLEGYEMPVPPDGWYLLAGWLNDTGNGNIGRNCRGEMFQPGGPYYIAYADQEPVRPAGVWVHVADLAPTFPGEQVEHCQILLTNFQSAGGVSLWDDLLLARVEPPWAAAGQ
jgi:hypothetical protein